MAWSIATFYLFKDLGQTSFQEPERAKEAILAKAKELGACGLWIVAQEGINTTFSCPDEARMAEFKAWFEAQLGETLDFKDSVSERPPFKESVVKIRSEIVTLGRPDIRPRDRQTHLSPKEWEEAIRQGAKVVDTRNTYETRIGSFKQALVPAIEEFTEFPEAFDQLGIDKEEKVLIFCTGGIRCEKAAVELNQRGYKNVFQLDGGILRYFEETQGELWDGECFVFDDRVAVDKNLQPTSKYTLCALCGNPADEKITCVECGTEALICPDCLPPEDPVCSKNCRYHFHRKKARAQKQSPQTELEAPAKSS